MMIPWMSATVIIVIAALGRWMIINSPWFPATADRHVAATFCLVFNPGQESSFSAWERKAVCMCPRIVSKFCSLLQTIIIFLKILVQHSEFRHLSLYHKGVLPALRLASKVESSPKTSVCCCPTFYAMIVGIKIESFQNELKVLQCFTPPNWVTLSLLFQPPLLLFQLWQCLQMLSTEQTPTVLCGARHRLLSAWQETSATLWPMVLHPEAHTVPVLKHLPAKKHISLSSHLAPCCSMYTAHLGVRKTQSWTSSLILTRVS